MAASWSGGAAPSPSVDEVAIRRARPDDAAAIAAVHVAAWNEAYAGLVPARMLSAFPVAERRRRWRRILTAPDPARESAAFVAVAPARGIIGFGSCGRQPAPDLAAAGFAGEFSALYLLASHQRQGTGRRLMARMAQNLLVRGMPAAALWVLRDNEPARRFYEALGAKIVGRRAETVDAFTGGRARAQDVLHEVAYGWRDLSALAPR